VGYSGDSHIHKQVVVVIIAYNYVQVGTGAVFNNRLFPGQVIKS
jgi:hypothetical protein